MNDYIMVKKSKYQELCADYLETKSKYKQALETIVDLTNKLEGKKRVRKSVKNEGN